MLAKNFKKYFLDEDSLVASYEWIRDLFQDTPEELSTSEEEIFIDFTSSLLKLVKRFEETGKLEDRARAGRPCLKEARAPCIAVEIEAIASEAASGTSSASEAARRLGLPPPSSDRNILR
ncbi:hypothetical protein TNCV_3588521 [Trichonephila clavipes]|nr:hypothetical protein TNCV_3588521 [Trichonephila clavipes]